jgi:glycogen synthase
MISLEQLKKEYFRKNSNTKKEVVEKLEYYTKAQFLKLLEKLKTFVENNPHHFYIIQHEEYLDTDVYPGEDPELKYKYFLKATRKITDEEVINKKPEILKMIENRKEEWIFEKGNRIKDLIEEKINIDDLSIKSIS